MPGAITRKSRSSRRKPEFSATKVAAIDTFVRVSKIQSVGKENIGKASLIQEAKAPAHKATTTTSQKRKAATAVELGEISAGSDGRIIPTSPVIAAKRQCRQPVSCIHTVYQRPSTPPPASEITVTINTASPATNQAELLLERLHLQSSPSSKRLTSRLSNGTIYDASELPRGLLDLLNLHTSFLKTLSMHFAHNGTNAPVDVRTICPSISQAWGKRRVTIDDVRRCIGIQGWKNGESNTQSASLNPPFFLSDYGRGKICVELRQGHGNGPLGEARLKREFEENLRALWSTAAGNDIRGSPGVRQFLVGLPTAPIRKLHTATTRVSPLLAKGQRTLEELKNGVVRKQQQQANQEESRAKTEVAPTALPLNADGTKMNLLERIRLRQVLQSQAADQQAVPSAAELQRRAALQRVDDVAAVVAMLVTATAAGRKRVSFTMTAVLLRLRDSLRVPMAQEEGAACVRLLAGEVAPEWLRVVTIGGKENVVVQADFQPSKNVILERVRALLM